jgi:transposase
MKSRQLNLIKEEEAKLKWLGKHEDNWRVRERAATILLLETGLSCEKVGLELGLSRGTVQTTKTGWLREKFDSLKDKARTGAPKKIKPQEEKMLLALANEKPLCATELLQVHLENGG